MATFADLTAAVQALLSASGASAALQLNSATRERAFEAYVFALVLRAVRRAGGAVQLMGIQTGQGPNPLVFRGSPGQMSSRAQDFAYARCILNGYEFEVHVDVQYLGTSGATHEIDVAVFDAERADTIRQTRAIPGVRQLHGAIECKFYDSTLGTGLGRAFVGLLDDCGSLRLNSFATNGRNNGLARYFSKKNRPQPFFGLSPLRPSVSERFVSDVEQALRKWRGVT